MSKHRKSYRHRILAVFAMMRMIILLPALFLVALDYGGVLPWSQWALGCSAVALLLLTVPEWCFGRSRRPLTAMLVSVALLVAAGGLLQTFRFPGGVVSILSRGSGAAYMNEIPDYLREEAKQYDSPHLQNLAAPSASISVSPSRTLSVCLIPILFATFCVASVCTFNSKNRLAVALFALAIFGAAISFIGIAGRIRPDNNHMVQAQNEVVQSFSTFVNRNNAALYLNLSIAATLGCLVWRYRQQRQLRPWDDRFDFDSATLLEAAQQRIRQFINCMDTPIIFLLGVSGLILAGICISGSRGGMLGVAAGVVAAAILAVSQRQTKFFLATAGTAMVLLFAVLALAGAFDQVSNRTSSLVEEDFSETARWQHWRDALPAVWRYLPAGAGLGAYRYAYLPYQQHSPGVWFQNADNLYLEMMVEGGLWLPLLLILGTIVLLAALRRLANVKDSTTATAVTFAGSYLIASLGVSQFFDFGALLPANYLTAAVLLGIVLGHADRQSYSSRRRVRVKRRIKTSRRKQRETRRAESSILVKIPEPILRLFLFRFVNPVLAVLLLAFLCVLINDAKARAEVDYWARTGQQFQRQQTATLMSLDPRLEQLDGSTDSEAQLALARWRILAYRGAVVRASLESKSREHAWRNSDQRVLRAVFYARDPAERESALASLVPGDGIKQLREARRNGLAALLASPLDVAARELLIQLDFLIPQSSSNDQLFQQIKQYRRSHPPTLHNAAKLAYVHPSKEIAFSLWRRAFEVKPEFLDMFWREVEPFVDEAEFIKALPDNPYLYVRFAELCNDDAVNSLMLQRAEQLFLASTPDPQDVAKHHFSRGRIAEMKSDYQAAEIHFARAVENDPTASDWRFRYVMTLQKNGRFSAAENELARCLQQEPDNPVYLQKEAELRLR